MADDLRDLQALTRYTAVGSTNLGAAFGKPTEGCMFGPASIVQNLKARHIIACQGLDIWRLCHWQDVQRLWLHV